MNPTVSLSKKEFVLKTTFLWLCRSVAKSLFFCKTSLCSIHSSKLIFPHWYNPPGQTLMNSPAVLFLCVKDCLSISARRLRKRLICLYDTAIRFDLCFSGASCSNAATFVFQGVSTFLSSVEECIGIAPVQPTFFACAVLACWQICRE